MAIERPGIGGNIFNNDPGGGALEGVGAVFKVVGAVSKEIGNDVQKVTNIQATAKILSDYQNQTKADAAEYSERFSNGEFSSAEAVKLFDSRIAERFNSMTATAANLGADAITIESIKERLTFAQVAINANFQNMAIDAGKKQNVNGYLDYMNQIGQEIEQDPFAMPAGINSADNAFALYFGDDATKPENQQLHKDSLLQQVSKVVQFASANNKLYEVAQVVQQMGTPTKEIGNLITAAVNKDTLAEEGKRIRQDAIGRVNYGFDLSLRQGGLVDLTTTNKAGYWFYQSAKTLARNGVLDEKNLTSAIMARKVPELRGFNDDDIKEMVNYSLQKTNSFLTSGNQADVIDFLGVDTSNGDPRARTALMLDLGFNAKPLQSQEVAPTINLINGAGVGNNPYRGTGEAMTGIFTQTTAQSGGPAAGKNAALFGSANGGNNDFVEATIAGLQGNGGKFKTTLKNQNERQAAALEVRKYLGAVGMDNSPASVNAFVTAFDGYRAGYGLVGSDESVGAKEYMRNILPRVKVGDPSDGFFRDKKSFVAGDVENSAKLTQTLSDPMLVQSKLSGAKISTNNNLRDATIDDLFNKEIKLDYLGENKYLMWHVVNGQKEYVIDQRDGSSGRSKFVLDLN